MNFARHIRAQLVLLIVLAATAGQPARAQSVPAQDAEQYWVIVAKSGEVTIVPSGGGTPVPAGIGTLLDAADRLITAGGGSALLASDADLLRLGQDSEIEIAPKQQDAGKTIILRKGSAQAKVRRRPDVPQDRFRIQTDYLAATVKGTIYTVTIEADLVSASVGEGTVRASPVVGQQIADDKGLDLHIGQTAMVYKAHPGIIVMLGEPIPDGGGSASPPTPPSTPPSPPSGGNHDRQGSPSSPSGPSGGGSNAHSGDSRP